MGTNVARLQIDDRAIELHMAGKAITQATLPALTHLVQSDGADAPDITFHLWDGAETGVWPPPPPFNSEEYRRYGHRAVAYDGSFCLMPHSPVVGMLYAYD